MVSTIKFSQFQAGNPADNTQTQVGVASGVNVISPRQNTWTTATRPASPFDGLMGYNTTLELWEYWQQSTLSWQQFITDNNGISWVETNSASIAAQPNMGFITTRTSTPVQILLPATFTYGDRILVMGSGSGGWSVVANAGQNIQFGSYSTMTAGSINSDIQHSNLELKGMAPSVSWTVWSINSNPTYI
jgi:hypothetical protein